MKDCSNCKSIKDDNEFPRTGKQCNSCLVEKRKNFPSVKNRVPKIKKIVTLYCNICKENKDIKEFSLMNQYEFKEKRRCLKCK